MLRLHDHCKSNTLVAHERSWTMVMNKMLKLRHMMMALMRPVQLLFLAGSSHPASLVRFTDNPRSRSHSTTSAFLEKSTASLRRHSRFPHRKSRILPPLHEDIEDDAAEYGQEYDGEEPEEYQRFQSHSIHRHRFPLRQAFLEKSTRRVRTNSRRLSAREQDRNSIKHLTHRSRDLEDLEQDIHDLEMQEQEARREAHQHRLLDKQTFRRHNARRFQEQEETQEGQQDFDRMSKNKLVASSSAASGSITTSDSSETSLPAVRELTPEQWTSQGSDHFSLIPFCLAFRLIGFCSHRSSSCCSRSRRASCQ